MPTGKSYTPRFDADSKSSHLADDIKLMWETQSMDKVPNSPSITKRYASTENAINAASRVFNTVELIGKSQTQVIELLGDPATSSNSIYNGAPFWGVPENAMFYRFDNGCLGWQFNVILDQDQHVVEVVRKWIH